LREIVAAGDPGSPADSPGAIRCLDIADDFRKAALVYIGPEPDRADAGGRRRRQRHGRGP
jgi:hypothetical protein